MATSHTPVLSSQHCRRAFSAGTAAAVYSHYLRQHAATATPFPCPAPGRPLCRSVLDNHEPAATATFVIRIARERNHSQKLSI